jgi:hypothetical protein
MIILLYLRDLLIYEAMLYTRPQKTLVTKII